MRGYLLLENRTDGTYLNLVKPDAGQQMVSLEELIFYLDKKSIKYGNTIDVRNAYMEAIKSGSARLNSDDVTPFSGWCEYESVNNGMSLRMRMFPAMKGMDEITVSEIEADLMHMKVRHGVDKSQIEKVVGEKLFFDTTEIACGTAPIDGYDAKVTYYFNTELNFKPKENSDGTVDFHQLDIINQVSANQVIARITPEDPGTFGENIYGIRISPKKVMKKVFRHGQNLKISDDGLELISLINGNASLDGEQVFVSSLYEISADVDNTTGDIDFDGNVKVNGNVLAGFSIKASGDVVINGVVEGCRIEAGGNIVLKRGMQGMSKGVLRAGGGVVASFIENGTVIAGDDIDADAILHSKVSTRGHLTVHGKNGYLIGGEIRAGRGIEAKTIGNEMETSTNISVGNDPTVVAEVKRLNDELTKCRKEKETLTQVVTLLKKKMDTEGPLPKDKLEMFAKSLKSLEKINEVQAELKKKYSETRLLISEDNDARIRITGSIYPGTRIEIGDSVLYIRDRNDHCQYVRKDAEVVRMLL